MAAESFSSDNEDEFYDAQEDWGAKASEVAVGDNGADLAGPTFVEAKAPDDEHQQAEALEAGRS